MAKTLSEDLLALLDADTQAKVRAAFASKPELIARDQKGAELIDIWSSFGGELEPTTTTTTATTTAHVPTVPSAATTTAAAVTNPTTTTTTPSNADGLAAILAKIDGMKNDLDAKLKNVVTTDKLPEYRAELLTLAIKSADDYATVRETHRAEFNETLDRNAFEKFVADSNTAGVKFPSMSAAHDVFVKDKRTTAQAAAEKAKIDAAVAEALKQARSAGTVPGQTQTTSLSPAQQVIAKARATAAGNNGETNAMRVARELEVLERSRATVQ